MGLCIANKFHMTSAYLTGQKQQYRSSDQRYIIIIVRACVRVFVCCFGFWQHWYVLSVRFGYCSFFIIGAEQCT